ncbi:DUF4232 domain-containing protein [Streptomyces sp. NPDC046261]|uniref:DUF4232 domain-containing protein n=1 Tax=Streptomyces sp. NPDC046261 TaxID=3157200 RepID=UPI0033EFE1E9
MNRPLGLLLVACVAALTGCGARSGETPADRTKVAPASSAPDHLVKADRLGSPGVRTPQAALPTAASGPRNPSGPPSRPSECHQQGVQVMGGTVDAAMGLRAFDVRLVNCGAAPYTVNGYPSVRVLDERKRVVDVTIHQDVKAGGRSDAGEAAPRPVRLRPGQAAVAVVMWRNTYDDPSRPPVRGTYLNVAPAADAPWQTLTPDGGVDLGSTGKLTVGPWRPAP